MSSASMCRKCWSVEKARQNRPGPLTEVEKAEHVRQINLAVFWLWLVAASSALNSLALAVGFHLRIPFGLFATRYFDQISASRESLGKRLVPVLAIAVIIAAFAFLGFRARRAKRWPLVLGGFCYLADAGILIPYFAAALKRLTFSFHSLERILEGSLHIAGAFYLFNAAYCLSIIIKARERPAPNQSSEPTSASGMSPAAQEPRFP
jgi:hypothetical protein